MSEEEGVEGETEKLWYYYVQQEVGESPRAGAWGEHDVKEIVKVSEDLRVSPSWVNTNPH